MRNKYLNLQTGTLLNAKELLDSAGAKDAVWKAADELYSLLSEMAEERENESQRLLMDAAIIRGHLKTYDQAQQKLAYTEHKEQDGEHLATLDELAAVKGVNVAAQWTDNHILQAYFSLKLLFGNGRVRVERLSEAVPNPDREPSKKEQVFETVEELGRATAGAVAQKTGINLQTVRNSISELLAEGMLADTGEKRERSRVVVTHSHTTKGTGMVMNEAETEKWEELA